MLIKGAIIGVNRVQIMGHWKFVSFLLFANDRAIISELPRDKDAPETDPAEIPLRIEEGEDGETTQERGFRDINSTFIFVHHSNIACITSETELLKHPCQRSCLTVD